MAQFELLLPKMGESVAEATIIKWLKNPGDQIELDEPVMEIATDKVDSEVPSPVSGKLVKQFFSENDVAQVGNVLAIIETDEPVSEKETESKTVAEPDTVEQSIAIPVAKETSIPGMDQIAEEKPAQKVSFESSTRFYSPLVKNIAAEEGISLTELENLTGTGADGRVTKQDILDYINMKGVAGSSARPAATQDAFNQKVTLNEAIYNESKPGSSFSGSDEIIEMDRMRKLIAEHMVMSKQVSPHVTSFVEADVTNLVLWREKVKNEFEKREGEKITFTPIFIEAVAKAIRDFPMINISVNGTQIIKKRDINIGMAAALPSGNLIVPVIKNADQLNLVGLTKAVNDLAKRARINKLQPDEVKEGTFTITNVGTFGNVLGTPIINQPQVAILAVGAIKKKPAVIETEFGDVIGIRHMMFLSLSYDHRVVDGALGGSFVKRIADYLEAWKIDREA
ncbi:2-oxo acid dehydrogenase subunit E2 [Pedobacter sp. HMF7647]|uniref:Dihydrolipoamide acetyltransferase component of pyruvate dehydrogenase complex n=1 Tax=Hufsiella arboris TaxID=2695275 RepID=A0A7K1YCX6_9SPHI|nr:dihydrolipoamide acetyltransferase family protein [Hufsiella arboris]MXV52442.1 2-oxo acid dehydrogenase subunit E2 [Hufsiella arboris]